MLEVLDSPELRPCTPNNPSDSETSSQQHSTPSRSVNTNGKRQIRQSKDGPATRRGDHLQSARNALERWRFKTKQDRYSPSSTTAVTLLPDPLLTTLASNARIRTVEDIEKVLNPPWIMARRHGEEVLAILKRLDDAHIHVRDQAKRAKADERRKVTEARQAEKREKANREREEKRQQKEMEKVEKDNQKAAVQAERKQQRDAARAEKQRRSEEAKAKRRQPLAGSGVFNTGPSTPLSMTHVRIYLCS